MTITLTQEVEKKWITVNQAVARVGVTERTLRRWLAEGLLKAYRPAGGRRVLIALDELDAPVEAGAERSWE
jgi:excisionase family DNA binding protein